jgi:hypothetical protein
MAAGFAFHIFHEEGEPAALAVEGTGRIIRLQDMEMEV